MAKRFWEQDIFDLADAAWDAVARFWKEEVWPLMMGVSFFVFLAVPLLVVLLVFWYLDYIGWAPEHGRYKVGSANVSSAVVMSATLAPSAASTLPRKSSQAALPPPLKAEIT